MGEGSLVKDARGGSEMADPPLESSFCIGGKRPTNEVFHLKKYLDAYLPILILYALSAYFLLDTQDFTEDSLMYPRGLAWVLIALTTLLLLNNLAKKLPAQARGEERVPRKFAVIFTASALYVFAVPYLGFVLSSLIYSPATILLLGYRRRGMALVISAVTVAIVYVGFKMLLKVPLPTISLFGISL